MASSLVKVMLHIVFHIKSHSVPIAPDDAHQLYGYIGGVIREVNGSLIAIGGTANHVHILATLPKSMNVPDFVRTIKANSSRWIKSLQPCYEGFMWQDGYGVFSVSASMVDKTVHYIANQEAHHKKRSFREEYKLFLDLYGIDYDERYVFEE